MRLRRAQAPVQWLFGGGAAIVVVAAGALAFSYFVSAKVVVTEAVRGPVVQAFYSTGTIQPEREFPIRSNTAGILTAVLVDKGTRVKKDQPLAIVSDPALVFMKDKAQAELTEKLKRADDKSSPVLAEFDARI